MLKIPNTKATSVDWCQGDLEHQPTPRPRPKHTMPDRVNPAAQHDKNQQLKAGISSTGTTKHNPGTKPH